MLLKLLSFILLAFILIVGAIFLRIFINQNNFFGKSEFKDPNCLTEKTFDIILEHEQADRISKYSISRISNTKIVFSKANGYTLFYLEKSEKEPQVNLVGLDGYGMRDKEFRYFVCELAQKIKDSI